MKHTPDVVHALLPFFAEIGLMMLYGRNGFKGAKFEYYVYALNLLRSGDLEYRFNNGTHFSVKSNKLGDYIKKLHASESLE